MRVTRMEASAQAAPASPRRRSWLRRQRQRLPAARRAMPSDRRWMCPTRGTLVITRRRSSELTPKPPSRRRPCLPPGGYGGKSPLQSKVQGRDEVAIPDARAFPPQMAAPGASAKEHIMLPVDEEEAFKLLLSNSLSGFAVLQPGDNDSGSYVFVSESMCSLLNLDKTMLEGRSLSEFLRAEDRGALAGLLSSARDEPAPPSQLGKASPSPSPYVRVRHACGDRNETRRLVTWKPVEIRAVADETGRVYLTLLDASMPVHVDSRLSDLLAFASHDLRTPCSSILTTVSLMRGMPTVAGDREAAALLDTVDAACVMLLRCVANVLFMRSASKSEDESSTSERTATSLRAFPTPRILHLRVLTLSRLARCPPQPYSGPSTQSSA